MVSNINALRSYRSRVVDQTKRFDIFFVFNPIWGRFPFWLIFFIIFQRGWNRQLATCLILVLVYGQDIFMQWFLAILRFKVWLFQDGLTCGTITALHYNKISKASSVVGSLYQIFRKDDPFIGLGWRCSYDSKLKSCLSSFAKIFS